MRPVQPARVDRTSSDQLMQIGEAAERVGLSIRTLRHYEEVGLIAPSARSEGGFRLYTEHDLSRLSLVKPMKPLGFTLEEMRELLDVLDALQSLRSSGAAEPESGTGLRERLAMFHTTAASRVDSLREQLANADAFAGSLKRELDS